MYKYINLYKLNGYFEYLSFKQNGYSFKQSVTVSAFTSYTSNAGFRIDQ